MPIQQQYYLNGPDLSSSTAIFLDALMTICAPNGFYSDGTIVRQQVGCVLSTASSCPDCGLSCEEATSIAGAIGLYVLNVDLGTTTGAVILTFTPNDTPDGIMAVYNGTTYNALSSPFDGYHAAPANLPTYVGNTANDCGLVAGSPYVLTEYANNGITFVATGNTPTVSIVASQVSLSAGNPLGCVMVIPKTNSSPTDLAVSMFGICSGSTYSVSVSCPELLPAFFSTGEGGTSGETCGLDTNLTLYSAPVNGNGIVLGLYDWIFTNPYGSTILPDGFYTAPIHCPPPYDSYEVQNGVIVQFLTLCSSVNLNYDVQDNTSACVSGGITSATLKVEWMPIGSIIVNATANASGTTTIQQGVYKATFTVVYSSIFSGCGDIDLRLSLNSVLVASNFNVAPVAGTTYTLTYLFSANGITNYTVEASVDNAIPL